MLGQVTTFDETKYFASSVWMLRMTLTWTKKLHSSIPLDIGKVRGMQAYSYVDHRHNFV